MLNNADFQGYNRLLTAFAIEKGRGGAFIADEIAPPTPSDTQEYAVPKFESALARQGITDSSVATDGKLNQVESTAPEFTAGSCKRRGLKSYTLDEIKAQPHGDLFANEEVEIADLIDDLRRENEIAIKAILDARKSVSGYHAAPAVKWDAASFTGVVAIENLEAAARAAEINSGKSLDSGNWRWIVPPLVADKLKSFLRFKQLYTNAEFQVGGKLPAMLAEIPVIIPGAMNNTAAAGQTASVARIWNTDDVYLVYVDPSFARNRRSFTALAQMRWDRVSPSYGAYRWRCDDPTCKRTHVATDIYDRIETLSVDGIYVVDDVLT